MDQGYRKVELLTAGMLPVDSLMRAGWLERHHGYVGQPVVVTYKTITSRRFGTITVPEYDLLSSVVDDEVLEYSAEYLSYLKNKKVEKKVKLLTW